MVRERHVSSEGRRPGGGAVQGGAQGDRNHEAGDDEHGKLPCPTLVVDLVRTSPLGLSEGRRAEALACTHEGDPRQGFTQFKTANSM